MYHYPCYYPYGYVSTAGPMLPGQAVLVLPLYLLGFDNIYFLNNFIVFLSYFLGGFSLYLLARELIHDEFSGIMAGLIFILMPLKHQNLPHLNLLFICFSIFSILHIYRYLKHKRLKSLFLCGIFYFLQGMFDLSYFFILSFLLPIIAVLYFFIDGKADFRALIKIALVIILFCGAVCLVFLPYITNPLDFEHSLDLFRYDNLISSYSLFTSRAFNHPKPVGDAFPMYLGFTACFLLSFFFYKKAGSKPFARVLSVLSALLIMITFISFNYLGMDTANIRYWADISLSVFVFMLLVLIILCWKCMDRGEKFVIALLFTGFVLFFQGLYSVIPFEFNLFRFLSHYIDFFGRMRGPRSHYLFQSLWIISSLLGIRLIRSDRALRPGIVVFLALLLLAENFPGTAETGALAGFDPAKKESYAFLENYPDHCGVLELPYFDGGPAETSYMLNTLFHDKQVYNGHFGMGIRDPLKIIGRGYLRGYQTLCNHLLDEEIISYIRDRGIYIIIAHRDMFVDSPSRLYMWEMLKTRFEQSREAGLIKEYFADDNCITAIIAQKSTGREFSWQLPYRYFRKKKGIVFNIYNPYPGNEIGIFLNGKEITRYSMHVDSKAVKLEIDSLQLEFKENYLVIKSSDEISIDGFNDY